MLEVRDLVRHYRLGEDNIVRAIDGITVKIDEGNFVVVYGPSGSGKSTLVELIAAAQKPDSGTVHFQRQDLALMSDRQIDEYRLTQLGVIGPPENLTEGATAIENASLRLALTNTRDANSGIVGLMGRLGLAHRLNHRTEELSMGERQRVMIALALSTKPRLILADEPTGNLDTENSENVLRLLRELCSELGAAVLLTTHDLMAASFADQLHELRDGHLREYCPDHILVPADSVGQRA